MILLDTNVISELIKPAPAPEVVAWLTALEEETLATTAITLAELNAGIAFLPQGRRRAALYESLERALSALPGLPVIAFGEEAASVYGQLAAARRQAGLHIEPLDLMIAAIAQLGGAALATRNVGDFEATGVTLINPWERL